MPSKHPEAPSFLNSSSSPRNQTTPDNVLRPPLHYPSLLHRSRCQNISTISCCVRHLLPSTNTWIEANFRSPPTNINVQNNVTITRPVNCVGHPELRGCCSHGHYHENCHSSLSNARGLVHDSSGLHRGHLLHESNTNTSTALTIRIKSGAPVAPIARQCPCSTSFPTHSATYSHSTEAISEAVRHVLDEYPGRMLDEDVLVHLVQQFLACRGRYTRVSCHWTDSERAVIRVEYSRRYSNVLRVSLNHSYSL